MIKSLFLYIALLASATMAQNGQCQQGLAGPFGLVAACCPRGCGSCGGTGCGGRPGGPEVCCGGGIVGSPRFNRSCDTNPPPCIIQSDPQCLTGLRNDALGLCCARDCGGTCGETLGDGCERRVVEPVARPTDSASRCCTNEIRAANRPCSRFPPPCTLAATPPQTNPTPPNAPQCATRFSFCGGSTNCCPGSACFFFICF